MADLNQTVAPLSTIISWFAEDATPTETQFETTWKSFFHKSENIPVEQIYQLAEILNLKAERDHMHFDLAKKDGSNLSVEDINGLKEVLGVALAANGIINNIETTITSEDANALQDGIYKPKTTGVFTAIGLTAKENYTTLFKKLDGVWSVFSEEALPVISIAGEVVKNNTEAVVGGKVFEAIQNISNKILVDTASGYITIGGVVQADNSAIKNILEKVILSIKTFDVDYQYLAVRQFNYSFVAGESGGHSINISIVGVDDLTTESNLANAMIIFGHAKGGYTSDKLQIFLSQNYKKGNIILDLDLSFFNRISHNFNFNFGNSGSYSKSGIKSNFIQKLPLNSFWNGRFDMMSTGTSNYNGDSFHLHEAIKDLKVDGLENGQMVEIRSISKNQTHFVWLAYVSSLNSSLTTGENYDTYRIDLPLAEGIGLKELTFVKSNQNSNKLLNISALVDFDYLNTNLPTIASNKEGSRCQFFKVVNSVVLLKAFNFYRSFYITSSGAHTYNTTYKLADVVKIPTGTTSLKCISLVLDNNANIAFLDEKFNLIEWFYKNTDGTKNTSTTQLNVTSVPTLPTGTKYIAVSTLTTSATSTTIIAEGLFSVKQSILSNSNEINEYSTIHEGLYSVNQGQYFKVGKNIFEKLNTSALTTSSYRLLNSADLVSGVDEYMPKGEKQIPKCNYTGNNGSFTGGFLACIKDDVMYFYNTNSRAIFKSIDGGLTYLPIADQFSHPSIFLTVGTWNEARPSVNVMDNGELLISIRNVVGQITSTIDGQQKDCVGYSIYRTTNNQTGLEKCFQFSGDFGIQDYNSSASNYGWVLASTGSMLSDWTYSSYGKMIVITEYGSGTSKYWTEKGVPNNGRGVSSCAWVSMDYGVTWKKFFDLNRKKTGTEISDTNWFYFASTEERMMAHIHCMTIDKYRRKLFITNGDGYNYIWSIDLDKIEAWYATAPAINPNESPAYKPTDTFPVWDSVKICDSNTSGAYKYFMAYGTMRMQMTAMYPHENGLLLGHDMSREFGYILHSNGISTLDYRIEPTFDFEVKSDYTTEAEYRASWGSTDGFVMQITRKDKSSPILFIHSGAKFSRIWATYDGFKFREVFKENVSYIGFGTNIHFLGNRVFLSQGLGDASASTGYFELKTK